MAFEGTDTYINFRLGSPQLASVGLSLAVADTVHQTIAPGLLASKVGLGLGSSSGLKAGLTEKEGSPQIIKPVGGIIRAVLLIKNRTWWKNERETWQGLEANFCFMKIGFEFGWYKELDDVEGNSLFSAGIGYGL